MYADLFAREGFVSAQVLATKEDFRDSHHYDNMKSCMENLLRDNVIPIVNENDVVAVAELLFTDNDELAGLIASQINADALLILTSVDGVIAGKVGDSAATVVAEVDFSDTGAIENIEKYITPEKSESGRGGMQTKFAIAKKLSLEGIATHIVNGKKKDTLIGAFEGRAIGTKFLPQKKL
jgi:glutamate 5-kinase